MAVLTEHEEFEDEEILEESEIVDNSDYVEGSDPDDEEQTIDVVGDDGEILFTFFNSSDREFASIQCEAQRVYSYSDVVLPDCSMVFAHDVVIDDPVLLSRDSSSGFHYVVDKNQVCHAIKPGWSELTWTAREDCVDFNF